MCLLQHFESHAHYSPYYIIFFSSYILALNFVGNLEIQSWWELGSDSWEPLEILLLFVWFFLPDSATKRGVPLFSSERYIFFICTHTQFITWDNSTNGPFIMPFLGSMLFLTLSSHHSQLEPPINKSSHLSVSARSVSSKSQHSKHPLTLCPSRLALSACSHVDFHDDIISLHLQSHFQFRALL